jgi:hypothetical protein
MLKPKNLENPKRFSYWLIHSFFFFTVLRPFQEFFTYIWRSHHYRWRAVKFSPMLGAQGLWAGRDLYRAAPAVTRGLGFSGLIRRTAPFSRLLRHTRGCGGLPHGAVLSIKTPKIPKQNIYFDVAQPKVELQSTTLKKHIFQQLNHSDRFIWHRWAN